MLRLHRYIVALILWLTFFFNVERIDLVVDAKNVSDIASPIYIVVGLVAVLGVLLPRWEWFSIWKMLFLSLVCVGIGYTFSKHPILGDLYTFVSLFELSSVLVTAVLSYTVGRLIADFVDTVRSFVITDSDKRVYTREQVEAVIRREMQHSRRVNRPLSVMVLDPAGEHAEVALSATAREIQKLLLKRYSLVSLLRLLLRTLRRTDIVLDRTEQGRVVVIMPEVRHEQIEAVIARLNESTRRRLGFTLRYGVASFPHHGLTFEELMRSAERNLRTWPEAVAPPDQPPGTAYAGNGHGAERVAETEIVTRAAAD